jgi:hypothetical protein
VLLRIGQLLVRGVLILCSAFSDTKTYQTWTWAHVPWGRDRIVLYSLPPITTVVVLITKDSCLCMHLRCEASESAMQ